MQQHIVGTPDAPQAGLMARKTVAKKSAKKSELIDVILDCLDDAKAENTNSIDIRGKSSLSDFMVVTSGRSHRHVGAVADQLSVALREAGFEKPRVEGMPHCDWVLVDASDVIVHIFRPEVREFYNLEKFWEAAVSEDSSSD